ncbi:TRAP-type C4-dicarboxylate transport system large permease component [Algibacter lectus]|uniref:TRAP-type C4-dicarboxylate transport system large permease component n=1 Tax=Algibacter lectus TaxID=221126 RepID=A0A090VBD9_9FLAO|nr:TRAP-type C4-dicarboxylate transport system large permease component [Algibacter lectus]
MCTPPVGTILFVGSGVANVSVSQVIKPLIPFLVIMVVVLLLITYIPAISMYLPRLLGL